MSKDPPIPPPTPAPTHIKTVTGVDVRPIITVHPQEVEERLGPESYCAVCGQQGWKVFQWTLGNHVNPEHWGLVYEEGFYFDRVPDCPVVYFNNAKSVYLVKQEVRTKVGIKSQPGDAPVPVCYCKNVTEEQILHEIVERGSCASVDQIREYTRANTGKLCHVTNPGGKCCGDHVQAVVGRGNAMCADAGQRARNAETAADIPARDPNRYAE